MTVSVIIPAYNSENTIAEALASVAAQTFRDFEVIVVDDASTDQTLEKAAAAVRVFEKARVLKLEANGGPARARNKGIAVAQGEWLAFLDSDDAWVPRKLELQINLVRERPELVLVCSTTEDFDQKSSAMPWNKDRGERKAFPLRTLRIEDFLVTNPVATSTVLVRKRAVLDVGGFDESLRGPEDFDLWMRIAVKHPSVRIEHPLAYYRQCAQSLSTNEQHFLPAIMQLLDKAYGPQGVLKGKGPKKRAQAYHLLSCAWMAANRGAMAKAVMLFFRSILFWPFSFRPALRLPLARSKVLLFMLRRSIRLPLGAAARTFLESRE